MSDPRLVLDLKKSVALIRGGEGKPWTRMPGAASMFNARDAEARETARLMSSMPTPKMAISDGNFTSPDDVVKGLGFKPNDETLWAHRVARMVQRAPNEVALRKSVVADLRESLEPELRVEMARRILSLYRQRAGGKPLEKGFPPKKGGIGKPSFKPAKPAAVQPDEDEDEEQPGAPAGKPDGMATADKPGAAPGRPGTMPAQGGTAQDAGAGSRNPAVDAAELTELPDDTALLQNKIHAMHEELKACQGPITGNAALIHLHNDLKAQMRDAYRDPTPEVVADIDHKIHHFKKLLEGPPPPEVDPNDPNAQQPGQDPGKPGAGGFGARGGAQKPGAMAGRQPGKRPAPAAGGKPPMMKSGRRNGGPPRPFDLGRRELAAAAFDDFVKGAGHKYLRRIPTGKVKPRYRYIYDAKKAVDTKARPQVGEKIKAEHNGQAGHYEVKRVMRDGRVEMHHDETGHRMVVHRSKLHDLVRDVHTPVDHALENARLDEKHRKVDILPRSRKAILDTIKQASGIDDHDLSQADAAYARWKAGGRKGPKPQRAGGAKTGGELDAFSKDQKKGKAFSSLLEAFEVATKGAQTWRDIAPVVRQLQEVPGFEGAHLPEDALLRHALQDQERREAPDTRRVNPEDYGTTVADHVDESGFDWRTGEQDPNLATPGQAKDAKKRARNAAKDAANRPQPAVADDEPATDDDTSFDFGNNAPAPPAADPADDDEGRGDMRLSERLYLDLRKADGSAPTAVGRAPKAPKPAAAPAPAAPSSEAPTRAARLSAPVARGPSAKPAGLSASPSEPSTAAAAPKASAAPASWKPVPEGRQAVSDAAHAATQHAMSLPLGDPGLADAHKAAQAAHQAAAKPGFNQARHMVAAQAHGQGAILAPGSAANTPAHQEAVHAKLAAQGYAAPSSEAGEGTSAGRKGPAKAPKTSSDGSEFNHLSGPVSGETPEQSVPKADGILQHGIVGHTSSGKQVSLGMDMEKLTPSESHEASLLHRDAQEHLLNAARSTGNNEYKKAARSHLDEEFQHAARSVASTAASNVAASAPTMPPGPASASRQAAPAAPAAAPQPADSVFRSSDEAAKSLAGWERLAAWHPSPMWAGEDIGASFGMMLSKAMGAEREGHKYVRRIPKVGGGYDYVYADEPHSKETLKGAPLGSKLEVTHGGHTGTYEKTGRDDWQGATGGSIASGWFVGKPSTLTHPGGTEAPAHVPAPTKGHDPAPWAPAAREPHLFGGFTLAELKAKVATSPKRAEMEAEIKRRETPGWTGHVTPQVMGTPAPKPFELTAKVVQQGLFGDSAYEKKAAPKAAPAVDKRQTSMFDPPAPSPMAEATKEAEKQPAVAAKPMTVAEARQLGAAAFAAGRGAASAIDPDFNARLKEHTTAFGTLGDQMIPVLKAWSSGWMAANMAAPVDEPEPAPEPAKEEPKSAMAQATAEAEKQPAVDADDAANAWKVEYDEKAEAEHEAEAAKEGKERHDNAVRHVEKSKEELATAKAKLAAYKGKLGTPEGKQLTRQATWAEANLKSAEERAAQYSEWSKRGLVNREAKRAAKKAAAEKHAGEAPARVKLASEARARIAAEEAKGKEKKLAVTDTKKINRQREREVGEHIARSAKDRSDERQLLTKGDLDALSFGEAHLLVNKRNAMPVYSSDQFKARGASPGAAHMGLALANIVAPAPAEDSDKGRRAYMDGIRLVRGIMDTAVTVDDYEKAIDELKRISGQSAWGSGGKPIETIHTARKLTTAEQAATRSAGNWRGSDYEGLDRPPGNYAEEVLTPRVAKDNPDLRVGARYLDGTVEFYTYSKAEKNTIREAVEALGKRFDEQALSRGKIWKDAEHQAKAAEQMGVAGWDHLEKSGEEKTAAKREEREGREKHEGGITGEEAKLKWRHDVSETPAVVKPAVTITSADPERMNDTFGFRGGQPGASIPNKELAHHHKYAEMAFHDLADVLGLDAKHISMKGRLAVAFAARGRGKARAHYEPEEKAINITRFAGAGSLAHEWGHFVDNVVAEQHRGESTKGRVYGSEGDHGTMAPELKAAFQQFRKALDTPNPETVRKIQADHDKRYAQAKETSTALRSHPGRLYSASPEDKADYKYKADGHNANLDAIIGRKKFLDKPMSDLKLISLAYDGGKEGKYWSQPLEMFARSFEHYVQHKLHESGRRNSYLVDGTLGDPDGSDDGAPYPRGAELPKIHGAIEAVVAAMKKGNHFEKALKALSSRPLTARRPGRYIDLVISK